MGTLLLGLIRKAAARRPGLMYSVIPLYRRSCHVKGTAMNTLHLDMAMVHHGVR
jgi:hypothetical protein